MKSKDKQLTYGNMWVVGIHSGAKLHVVLPDSKNIEVQISKKSKVLSLMCKKVCHKWK